MFLKLLRWSNQISQEKSAKENPILNEIKSSRVELNETKSLKADVAMLN